MGLQAGHDGQELLVGLLGFKDQFFESLVHGRGVGVRMSYADFAHEAPRVNASRPQPIIVHNFPQVCAFSPVAGSREPACPTARFRLRPRP